jgi:iron(III) transport system substrate-binding protein
VKRPARFVRFYLYIRLVMLLLLPVAGCERKATEDPSAVGAAEPVKQQVVVYTAHDRSFSEPILDLFEKRTGIEVLAVYDTESTKSVGLTNRIMAERERPRCDVYWNNEVLNTLRLQAESLLAPSSPAHAADYPERMRDPKGEWFGFAARARILIVNTELVSEAEIPLGMADLLDPKWQGRFGLAKPVAGTTATHVACLFQWQGADGAKQLLRDLKENGVSIESGNKACAELVGAGELAVAWTDTDDAMIEIDDGNPVRIVYPDQAGEGTLLIPNTVARIAGCPHPAAADQLINFLLSPEVEGMLAQSQAAQIPLNRKTTAKSRLNAPDDLKIHTVDFAAAAAKWDVVQAFIQDEFLR